MQFGIEDTDTICRTVVIQYTLPSLVRGFTAAIRCKPQIHHLVGAGWICYFGHIVVIKFFHKAPFCGRMGVFFIHATPFLPNLIPNIFL